jgi:hypothetical protein
MDEFDFSAYDAQRYAEDMADLDAVKYGNDDDFEVL